MMEQWDLWRKSQRQMLLAMEENIVASKARPWRWVVCGMWESMHVKMAWQAV